MAVKWWAVQAVQGCVAVCCPCCSIVPAHFLLQRSVCLVSLWIVPCACHLSTFGYSQQWPGKHHTLGHKCEHMQSVCVSICKVLPGHLPKIDHMNGDDTISPHLMVLMCEVAISQTKQQPGNCAWLLAQRSHTEKIWKACKKVVTELGLTQPEAAPPAPAALPRPHWAPFLRVLQVPLSSWTGQQRSGQCILAACKPVNVDC